MTDKELLQLAAKAAGLTNLLGVGIDSPIPYWLNDPKQPEPRYWNPLEDDGDAFRLANALQLTVQIGRLDGTVVVTSNNDDSIYVAEVWLPGENSVYASRSAIVRAAAEIGKIMK